jgi:hypothetical protein
MFVTTATVRENGFPENAYPFYRPTQGHQLTGDAVYAVRLNELYEDRQAAFTGERYYIREAMIRANHMIVYVCSAKHPILT